MGQVGRLIPLYREGKVTWIRMGRSVYPKPPFKCDPPYFVGEREEITQPTTADIQRMLTTTETVIMGVAPGPAKADQTGAK